MVSERTVFLKGLLTFGGHWMKFEDLPLGFVLSLLQWARHAYLFLGLVLIWISLFTNGLSFLLTPTAVFIPLGLNIVVTSVVLVANFKNLEILVKESERNISTYKEVWEKEIIARDTKLMCKLANFMIYGLCSFGLTYIILPFLIDGVRAYLGYSEPYIVPLPLDGYFSQNKTRSFYYYTIVICSDLWFLLAVPNTVAYECMIFLIISYTTSEIKIVIRYLRMLHNRSGDGVLLTNDWDLRHIVKKHQQIVRLNKLQKKHITLPYICQVVISALSICFTMFLVNQTIGRDLLVTVLGCTFILILLGVISVMCYSGEYLEEMGDQLFLEICNLPWYTQSPRARKDFIIMLTQSSKKLVLEYANCFSLNLQANMQIINTAYSYYMLMKSAQ